MALTAEQYQDQIVSEVGDVDDVVFLQIDTLWQMYSSETDLFLQYLLAKRKALDVLQGYVREHVDQADIGASVKLSQKLANLQTMWNNVDREITTMRAEAKVTDAQTLAATYRPLTGRLTATLGPASDAVRLLRQ